MLPAEEYAYLKRKFEAEKAARIQVDDNEQHSYDANAFAHAIHGMPVFPPRTDSYFRMKPGMSSIQQPKYKDKKKCAPVYVPPRPRPEYSNPQIRNRFGYKPPSGMAGKAAEVLGVVDKRIYGKPLPPLPLKKASKWGRPVRKPVMKNATKPLTPLPGAYGRSRRSTGCVVM